MTTTTGDGIFKRLGVFIRWWYALRDMKSTLESLLGDMSSDFTAMKEFISSAPSTEDRDAYEAISIEIRRQKEELESTRQSVVNLVSEFFGTDVKALLDSPYSTPEAVLDHLLDAMDDNDDHVLKNDVDADEEVAEDEDNSVKASDGLSLNFGVGATQMARDDRFALTCVDDSMVGGERWTLESARQAQYYGEVVTGQAVNWDAAGIEELKVNAAPVHDTNGEVVFNHDGITGTFIEGDLCTQDQEGSVATGYYKDEDESTVTLKWISGIFDDSHDITCGSKTITASSTSPAVLNPKVVAWTVSGAVRGTNVASDGMLYLEFNPAPTLTKENDDLDQLTAFDFTTGTKTAVFGDESDIDGRLYVSLVKEPAKAVGGVLATLDDVNLDGVTPEYTNDGFFDVTVGKAANTNGSDYTIDLYATVNSEVTKVATGTVYNIEDLPVEIAVSDQEETGSGITGSIVLADYDGPDGNDDSIIIQAARHYVRLYRSASRSTEDLVSQGYSLEPDDSVTLSAVESFATNGTVTMAYVEDNEDIVLSGMFHTIDAYRADPDDDETTEDDIVGRGGSLTNLLTGNAVADLAFYAVNGSGLTGSADLTDETVSDGYVASAQVGFANGDKFTFETECTHESLFQTFLRDNFGKVFPEEAIGDTPEVDEDWAIPPDVNLFLPRTGQTTTTPTSNYRVGDDGYFRAGNPRNLRFVDNGDGTVSDRATGLMWVKQPELIIPGATGVHATNQIQRCGPNYGSGVGVWVTNSEYLAADLITTGGLFYVCAETHTSDTFATDLDAGKWRKTVWTASADNLTTPAALTWYDAIDYSLGEMWNSVNMGGPVGLSYAGFTDWRLPHREELAQLVDSNISSGAMIHPVFTNAKYGGTTYYWSSTTHPGNTPNAYYTDFTVAVSASAVSRALAKTNTFYVRPVRGGRLNANWPT